MVQYSRVISPGSAFLEPVHDHRGRERELVVSQPEHLLPDQLGDLEALGLGREVVGREHGFTLGQLGDEQPFQSVHVGAVGGRERHEIDEGVGLLVVVEQGQELRLRHQIDLRQHEYGRHTRFGHEIQQEAVAGPRLDGRIHDQHHDVHLAHRVQGRVHHAGVEAMGGLVDAGGVHEHRLGVGILLHADDPRTRGLRLVGHDGQFLPDDPVEEGGLPRVGAADEGDGAAPHGSGLGHPASAALRRRTRTLVMRRRSTSSTSTARSPASNVSPT